MSEETFQKNIDSYLPFSTLMYYSRMKFKPFICVITPVFDPALAPLELLMEDLRRQSFKKFLHVSISNGLSAEIKDCVDRLRKKDKRFIYEEIPFEETPDWQRLLVNIGKRRTYAMKKHQARRYMFIDADSAVPDDKYLSKLFIADYFARQDVIITQTLFAAGTVAPEPTLLPHFPIELGKIDITNFSFSQSMARMHQYPQDIDQRFGPANDYRFFSKISNAKNTIYFPVVGVDKNVNKSYKSITQIYHESIA